MLLPFNLIIRRQILVESDLTQCTEGQKFFLEPHKSRFLKKIIFGQSWKYSDNVGNIRTALEILGQLLGLQLFEYFQPPVLFS